MTRPARVVADVLRSSVPLPPRAALADAVAELENGWPVIVCGDDLALLTPAAAVGYPRTRRLGDLPTRRCVAIPADLPLLDFIAQPLDLDTGFAPVTSGDKLAGIASRLAAFELVRQDSQTDVEEETAAATMSAFAVRRIAHDLNNLLAAAAMTSGALEQDLERGAVGMALADLKRIDGALEHASLLVKRLRGLPESGHREVSLHSLIESTVDLLRPLAPRARLKFESTLEDDKLETDAVSLQQILENLIINANEATPHGGDIHIRLDAGSSTREVLLTVEDDGVGIPESELPRITEPFFSTKAGPGRGLGLSIVKEAVKQIGGRLVVHSRPARGSRFDILFPRHRAS